LFKLGDKAITPDGVGENHGAFGGACKIEVFGAGLKVIY
jgi:hypothetical protein